MLLKIVFSTKKSFRVKQTKDITEPVWHQFVLCETFLLENQFLELIPDFLMFAIMYLTSF
jgi:hypothetical protein